MIIYKGACLEIEMAISRIAFIHRKIDLRMYFKKSFSGTTANGKHLARFYSKVMRTEKVIVIVKRRYYY